MEKFQALIFALACMLVLPGYIYLMVLLWQYKEWIAILTAIAIIYVVIRLLQWFDAWQKAKITVMFAKAEKEQLMSHVIAHEEVVVYVDIEQWLFEHLSAEHERAKAFASTRLQVKEEISNEGLPSEDSVVKELLSIGMQPHDIAMRTRVRPERVIEIGKESGLLTARLPERSSKE